MPPRLAGILAFALLLGYSGRPAVADYNTYIALGDSLAFGEYRFEGTSNGDRGYVSPFADYLGTVYGARPGMINLGVDGETSTTFFNGGTPGLGPVPGSPGYVLNTNYSAPYPTQNQMLLSTIASETAAGHTISNVTIQLGANDLYVVAATPGFGSLTPAQQFTAITAVLNAVANNDAMLLTELKTLAPHANIVMMGYYDPYAPFYNSPSNPLSYYAQLSHGAIPGLNQTIAGVASAFGVSFVNPYPLFVGNELAYTDVANGGNSHPNAEGYAQITGLLVPVPEPSAIVSMATAGLTAAAAWANRRKRRGLVA